MVIIGVHTPEFSHEKDIDNMKEAINRLEVPYPVVIDNNWQTWRAYNNHYWPAKYIIDKTGHIRYIHIGEGGYEKQEQIVKALLVEET
ncbi:MAG: redoxin domain-containing protein [Anaerolineae bacterium]|nr:redoxin domain-containing protein [Anaerolineae bacterium]